MNAFEKLIRRNGGFSLPFLVHLYNEERTIEMFFINGDQDVVYNGQIYQKAVFSYQKNTPQYGFDGGGKVEITVKDNQTIDLVESSIHIHLSVVATMNENNSFTELKNYKHEYGIISANRKTISFEFDKDDRPDMTFPTLIWSTLNNKGNS